MNENLALVAVVEAAGELVKLTLGLDLFDGCETRPVRWSAITASRAPVREFRAMSLTSDSAAEPREARRMPLSDRR